MPRITIGKEYRIPNAGTFRRLGEDASDGWEVLDRDGDVLAKFPTGALCRGFLNKLREATELGGANGRRRIEKLEAIAAKTLKGSLDPKELVQFEGANKRVTGTPPRPRGRPRAGAAAPVDE